MPGSIGLPETGCQLVDTWNPHMLLRTYAPPKKLSLVEGSAAAAAFLHPPPKLCIDFTRRVYLLLFVLTSLRTNTSTSLSPSTTPGTRPVADMSRLDKKTIREGNGSNYPKPGDTVIMEYTGWLYDANKADNQFRGNKSVEGNNLDSGSG